jgi:hypothetical protein
MTKRDRLVLWLTFSMVFGQFAGSFIFHVSRFAIAHLP